ncbi:YadA-like family protein [Synechococcus sp. UW140]|uniref:YadA-like family protein n=1 Tax=Synechococcus sp. UW140 TaxID=368503 RepID=UPI000E0F55D1|nr:YadA-like family protein [Synechococcus sp. UW140]
MKRLGLTSATFLSLCTTTFLCATGNRAQADSISTQPTGASLIVKVAANNRLNLYRFNDDGSTNLLHEDIFPDQSTGTFDAHFVDEATGKVYLQEDSDSNPNVADGVVRYRIYNAKTNKFEGWTVIKGLPSGGNPTFVKVPFAIKDVVNKLCDSNNGETCIDNSDVISLGGEGSNALATIDEEGLSVGGKSIVRREINADGEEELHIGENSLVTVESDGVQKLYATDAEGNKIPINITEGSDLQINGVSVQGQLDQHTTDIQSNTAAINDNKAAIKNNSKAIDNLEEDVNALGSGVAGAAALSAALSALPTVSDDAPFSCGVGTGGYSSRYAMGVGCAARLNKRLSFNAGGSVLFGGASDYGNGSLDTVAGRAGFVFKLGSIQQASNKNNQQLQSQLDEVKEENAEIKQQNKALMARLERLEAIALGQQLPTATQARLR